MGNGCIVFHISTSIVDDRKRLNYFQAEVSVIMKAIGFSFNDFDFVIDAFQLPGMDRIVTVVENPIPITAKGLDELGHCRMTQSAGQRTSLVNGLVGPGPGSIGPNVFEFFFKDQNGINHFVQF